MCRGDDAIEKGENSNEATALRRLNMPNADIGGRPVLIFEKATYAGSTDTAQDQGLEEVRELQGLHDDASPARWPITRRPRTWRDAPKAASTSEH